MKLGKTLLQTAGIVILCILLGFANHIINPNRVNISLNRPDAPVSDDSTFEKAAHPEIDGPAVLSKKQLLQLIQNHSVVLIDARSENEYSLSHLPTAINIPFDQIGEHIERVDALPSDKWLVTYCEGPPCDKSIEMATILFETGFERVAYYYAGFDDWKTTEEIER